MSKPRTDFAAILRTLVDSAVEFIVLGGVKAVLQGAPITTFDLEIVRSRSPDNLHRLERALEALNARCRDLAGRIIRPRAADLDTPGHHLPLTDFGPLDLPGAVGSGRTFGDLISHADELELGGMRVRVLDLETLIQVKEETGQLKDKAVLPILGQALSEKRKRLQQ